MIIKLFDKILDLLKRILGSAWASVQSVQSLCRTLGGQLKNLAFLTDSEDSDLTEIKADLIDVYFYLITFCLTATTENIKVIIFINLPTCCRLSSVIKYHTCKNLLSSKRH